MRKQKWSNGWCRATQRWKRSRGSRSERSESRRTALVLFRSSSNPPRGWDHEKIKLVICEGKCGVTLLKAALADPQASKICALVWEYDVEEDMNSVIPLLNNNCPELALLLVKFEELSDFDLVSSLLEHPCAKVKVLVMPPKAEGAPNNEMKELSLWYDDTASSIKTHLVPALKHPNCNLSKLSLGTNRPEHKATAFRVVGAFRNHRVLVVLLQGQQLRRRYCDCPWRC